MGAPLRLPLLLVLGVFLVSACDLRPPKQVFLEALLDERAPHLDSTERSRIVSALLRAEARAGVDALLLAAVAEMESHFRRSVRSRKGAVGLLQIRPVTAGAVAERHAIRWSGADALEDPAVNALIGAAYLSELRERFGSWDLALTAYNQGPTRARRLQRRGASPSSRYATRVLKRYEMLKQAFEEDA